MSSVQKIEGGSAVSKRIITKVFAAIAAAHTKKLQEDKEIFEIESTSH